MRKSLIIAVLIISLTGTAAMGQKKYQRPAIETPDTFRGVEGTGPTDQTSVGDLKWFEVFQDEELQKLVRTAMVQNYDLRLAVARINGACQRRHCPIRSVSTD
jgi:multidrug efflux system outer membrane protein